ncbi:MAG: hypothetical protein AAGA58_00030 [Verrucomicrobiota bacterium]
MNSHTLTALLAIICFLLGVAISLLGREPAHTYIAVNPKAVHSQGTGYSASTEFRAADTDGVSQPKLPEKEPRSGRVLALPEDFIGEVIEYHDLLKPYTAESLGIPEDLTDQFQKIEVELFEKIQSLEEKHAQKITGDDGKFVQVEAFAEEMEAIIKETEEKLQPIAPGDQAAVIAKSIIHTAPGEYPGKYRREFSFVQRDDGVTLLEKRDFNQPDGTYDADYATWDSKLARQRWGHLLAFPKQGKD